jgi:thiol-disulfide isomerase/thioredoxin
MEQRLEQIIVRMRRICMNNNKYRLNALSRIAKVTAMFLLFMLTGNKSALANESFLVDRERGWFWFENECTEKESKKRMNRKTKMTREMAKQNIDNFKKEMEDLNALWLEDPSIENAKNMMELEFEMFKKTEKAVKARQLVTLTYPHLDDNLTNPSNVQALRLKKEIDAKNHQNIIKQFAKQFDLVVFLQSSCKSCQEFEPVLKTFADTYTFKVEAVSDVKSRYFSTSNDRALIDRLNVRGTPTVFVVHKTLPIFFELIANYVSISELGERIILANDYVKLKLQNNANTN